MSLYMTYIPEYIGSYIKKLTLYITRKVCMSDKDKAPSVPINFNAPKEFDDIVELSANKHNRTKKSLFIEGTLEYIKTLETSD